MRVFGPRRRILWGLTFGVAAAVGAGDGVLPANAGEFEPRAAECADECPDGTRRASYEAVVTGRAAIITGYRCETICEALLPCPPPNIPTIVTVAGVHEYSCAPLPGFSSIPAPNEIDFSFAVGWTP